MFDVIPLEGLSLWRPDRFQAFEHLGTTPFAVLFDHVTVWAMESWFRLNVTDEILKVLKGQDQLLFDVTPTALDDGSGDTSTDSVRDQEGSTGNAAGPLSQRRRYKENPKSVDHEMVVFVVQPWTYCQYEPVRQKGVHKPRGMKEKGAYSTDTDQDGCWGHFLESEHEP